MEFSDDQIQTEIKRNIALYVGGIGSILFGVVFLLFESVLIRRDNKKKTRMRADALRREAAIHRKLMEEQQLKDKSKKPKRNEFSDSEEEDDDDDDTNQTLSSDANRGDDKQLNGFFRRQSAIAIVTPLADSQMTSAQINLPVERFEHLNSLKVPEINEPRPIEMPRSRKESITAFKDHLAAALQSHVQSLRGDSAVSSRRTSTAEAATNLTIESCGSSLINSRRTSAVDSPAHLQGSRISSLANSRRPSAANALETVRVLPEYEAIKFVPGMTGFEEPPRYAAVVGKSRRGSMDNQGGLQGYSNPLMFGESAGQSLEFDPISSDVLPAIPESPHPSQKKFN